jgi:hypothetical protein
MLAQGGNAHQNKVFSVIFHQMPAYPLRSPFYGGILLPASSMRLKAEGE